jgi:hypothetical protein
VRALAARQKALFSLAPRRAVLTDRATLFDSMRLRFEGEYVYARYFWNCTKSRFMPILQPGLESRSEY